jgi:hypothetical protein
MRSNRKIIGAWTLATVLLTPSLHAKPKSWDSQKGFPKGRIIVTTQEGERLETTDVVFNQSGLIMQSGRKIARADVKEVEIRARRNFHLFYLGLVISPILAV